MCLEWLQSTPYTDPTLQEDVLLYKVVEEDVLVELKRLPWQSSPGPDGVPYHVWKSASISSPKFLASVFNTCLINGKIPKEWKKSNTILLPKSGDRSLPRNWRPISLQPTIYKIFAALLARCLATWALDEGKNSLS